MAIALTDQHRAAVAEGVELPHGCFGCLISVTFTRTSDSYHSHGCVRAHKFGSHMIARGRLNSGELPRWSLDVSTLLRRDHWPLLEVMVPNVDSTNTVRRLDRGTEKGVNLELIIKAGPGRSLWPEIERKARGEVKPLKVTFTADNFRGFTSRSTSGFCGTSHRADGNDAEWTMLMDRCAREFLHTCSFGSFFATNSWAVCHSSSPTRIIFYLMPVLQLTGYASPQATRPARPHRRQSDWLFASATLKVEASQQQSIIIRRRHIIHRCTYSTEAGGLMIAFFCDCHQTIYVCIVREWEALDEYLNYR